MKKFYYELRRTLRGLRSNTYYVGGISFSYFFGGDATEEEKEWFVEVLGKILRTF